MIFSSFGNVPAKLSFTRMAKAVDEFAKNSDEEVLVQIGNTVYDFKYANTVKFLTHDSMLDVMSHASILILSGGWGTISEASQLGKRIVAMPRRADEHNHPQEEVVRKLEEMGVVVACYDEKELPTMVEKARTYDFKPILRGSAAKVINDFLVQL